MSFFFFFFFQAEDGIRDYKVTGVQTCALPISGCIVRPACRLLWPHLRLCRPPNGLWIIPPGCGTSPPAAEGPQFTLPVLSPHAVARTPVAPTSARNDVFLADIGLRHLCTGSATTWPSVPDPARIA